MSISSENLANTLDKIAGQLESGMGFDQAILSISKDQSHALASEFALILDEIQSGISRREALQYMAEQVSSPDFAALVNDVIKADQTGTSIVEVLRSHAQQLRAK